MEKTNGGTSRFKTMIRNTFGEVPLLGWLLGCLVAVILEQLVGYELTDILGMSKVPVLFGFVIMLKKPLMIPSSLAFVVLIYLLPICAVARLSAPVTNRLAARLMNLPTIVPVLIHLGLLYCILHFWSDMSAYRDLSLRLTLIAIMLTLSVNVINGYMGEFSCSHPGFMALGAYPQVLTWNTNWKADNTTSKGTGTTI